jgi:hypothetical protein
MPNPNKSSNIVNNPSFLPSGEPVPSEQLVNIVRERVGNRLILSFSGKDSLATWLFLRDRGFELIPYFCYSVPGLAIDEEMIVYYEKFFKTTIYRLPHPLFYEQLSWLAFQTPDTARIINSMHLKTYDWAFIEEILGNQNGLGGRYFSAVGIRAADNLMRNRMVHQMGPLGFKRRSYYWAIWDYKIADVMETIHKAKVKLPKHYQIWGSTGDSIDYTALKYLKDNHPADYQRFLDYFPLVDIEIFRYEKVK